MSYLFACNIGRAHRVLHDHVLGTHAHFGAHALELPSDALFCKCDRLRGLGKVITSARELHVFGVDCLYSRCRGARPIGGA